MSSNVQEFTLGIAESIDEADERREQLTRVVAMRGLRDVVLGTRVDTGRARGNWQVAEGQPPTGYDEDVGAPGGREGADAPTRREDPLSKGNTVIGGASGKDVIWLHNGLPYIQILEDWDGMVQGSYEALRTWIRSLR